MRYLPLSDTDRSEMLARTGVGTIDDLLELPIRTGAGPPISIRDVGSVSDSTDIPTAYALVNGRRAVYIPVTKRADASRSETRSPTWSIMP